MSKRFYWIKLKENFFDLETIDWLMSQPNGCEYVVLYQKLCLMTANRNGELFSKIGEMIVPYDVQKIARDTKFSFDTVAVAMELFKKIGLIYEQQDGVLRIPYVEELVGSETSSAKRVREHRAKKALQCNTDVTQEKEIKRLENRDIENRDVDIESKSKEIEQIADLYNEICISFTRLRALSDARKKAIKARLNSGYTHDDFVELFTKAEQSSFLKGKNDRNWCASFDWLIKDANMAKVLDGNYADRNQKQEKKQDDFMAQLQSMYEEEQ